MPKKKTAAGKKKTQVTVDRGRRKLMILGAGALAAGGTAFAGYKAGWFTTAPPVKTVVTPGVLTILPPEILSVGNRRSMDIRSAKQLGMKTCLFLHGEHRHELPQGPEEMNLIERQAQ